MTASYNSDVDITVRFAYGQDVYETSPSWTDETSDVMSFSTSRGRSRILDQMQSGTATIRLLNTSGDYSPWNTSGANSPDVDVLTKVNIQAVHNSTTYDLFTGYVIAWPNQWNDKGKLPFVELRAVDGFHLLAMVEEELTESQEASGTRVGNLLDVAGWPAGWRNIDTGDHTVAALSAEFNSVLGEIERTRLVEDGLFFIAGDGDATYLDGTTRLESTAQATFSDDGSDVGYQEIQVDYDLTQLWNNATVTRSDGTSQTSTDATSVASYGQRDLHLSETVHVADGEALALADWMVAEFKDPRARVPSLMIHPEEDPTNMWPQVLGRELWDKVNVELTTPAGSGFDEDIFIEGVTHNVTMVGTRSWQTTVMLSPGLPFDDWWILGTSELGTDTRLGY